MPLPQFFRRSEDEIQGQELRSQVLACRALDPRRLTLPEQLRALATDIQTTGFLPPNVPAFVAAMSCPPPGLLAAVSQLHQKQLPPRVMAARLLFLAAALRPVSKDLAA